MSSVLCGEVPSTEEALTLVYTQSSSQRAGRWRRCFQGTQSWEETIEVKWELGLFSGPRGFHPHCSSEIKSIRYNVPQSRERQC